MGDLYQLHECQEDMKNEATEEDWQICESEGCDGINHDCPRCGGDGWTEMDEDFDFPGGFVPCWACRGEGKFRVHKTVDDAAQVNNNNDGGRK